MMPSLLRRAWIGSSGCGQSGLRHTKRVFGPQHAGARPWKVCQRHRRTFLARFPWRLSLRFWFQAGVQPFVPAVEFGTTAIVTHRGLLPATTRAPRWAAQPNVEVIIVEEAAEHVQQEVVLITNVN